METIYETIVGLEIHVQILTHSKAFSKDGNSFANQANANAVNDNFNHSVVLSAWEYVSILA